MNITEKQIDVQEIAAAVAEFMPGWKYQQGQYAGGEPASWAELHHTDTGAELHISANGWRQEGKLHISGQDVKLDYGLARNEHGYTPTYSQTVYAGGSYSERHSINVSAKKAPKVIALDIQRRIAPDYCADYVKALESGRRYVARIKADNDAAAELSRRYPYLEPYPRHNSDEKRSTLHAYKGPHGGTVEVTFSGGAKVEIDGLSTAQVHAILNILEAGGAA